MISQVNNRLNILWIKADPLHPADSGGRIRTYKMLLELSVNHEITYLALFPKGTDKDAKAKAHEYSSSQIWIPWKDTKKKSLRFLFQLLKNFFFSKNPFVIDKYSNHKVRDAVEELLSRKDFDFVISDFLSLSGNIINLEKRQSKFIVFQHNVESQIWQRHYQTASNIIEKAYMYIQWQRFQRFEKMVCSWFDGVIGVSKEDVVFFRQKLSLTNVLGDVPTGVDVEYFQQMPYLPENNSIVFLGSMDWLPNIEGICHFVKKVYPLIVQQCPEVTLTIVGRNPTAKILALAKDKNITVTGTVDDVRTYLSKSKVSIVPLLVGGGTRIKIFELMATGIPVVSTSIGAEGLPVQHSKHILMADEPDAFASEVIRLLENPELCRNISDNALKLVKENYSWKIATRRFEDLLINNKER
jgi:glycosyltransferase involved in cell wall biosynthesis